MRILRMTYLVRDYDEAIDYFVGVMGFDLIEDTVLSAEKRWVVVAPSEEESFGLLLAKASNPRQAECIGDQTGGRVFLFIASDNFEADHERLLAAGVKFLEAPRKEAYGMVAVFEDLYGHRWDLIERR